MQKLSRLFASYKVVNLQILIALLAITQVVIDYGPPGGA